MKYLIIFTYLAVALGFGFAIKVHKPDENYAVVAVAAFAWPALWGAAQVDAHLNAAR